MNHQLFTKFTTGQWEQPALYKVHNWSVATTSSLPSSQLVSENNQLFTKLTTGQSEQLPLYQVYNWSIRTTTSLPSSQLVNQNNQLFAKSRTGLSKPPPLYQVQNWSARSGTGSKTTEQQAQTWPPQDNLGSHLWPVDRLGWQGLTVGQTRVARFDRWTDSGGKV